MQIIVVHTVGLKKMFSTDQNKQNNGYTGNIKL